MARLAERGRAADYGKFRMIGAASYGLGALAAGYIARKLGVQYVFKTASALPVLYSAVVLAYQGDVHQGCV